MTHPAGLPLPQSVSMAWEFRNQFPYNAGIMLMNLPELRSTYREFIKFILANKHGLHFGSYGPADQVCRLLWRRSTFPTT